MIIHRDFDHGYNATITTNFKQVNMVQSIHDYRISYIEMKHGKCKIPHERHQPQIEIHLVVNPKSLVHHLK